LTQKATDFKEPNDALANQFLGEQLEDGGWNCEAWPFLSPGRMVRLWEAARKVVATVCVSTPWLASATSKAPSQADRARETSVTGKTAL